MNLLMTWLRNIPWQNEFQDDLRNKESNESRIEIFAVKQLVYIKISLICIKLNLLISSPKIDK